MSRSNRWVFTLNNYTNDEESHIQDIECKYLVYGREVGEQGTPHLQGYVIFNKRIMMTRAKNLISQRAHVEKQRGKNQEAADYCKKDGNFFEKGELPPDRESAGGAATKKKWEDAYNAAVAGDFDAIPKELYCRYMNNFKKIYQEELNRNTLAIGDYDLKKHFIWIYGPTGTGKSHLARSLALELDPEHPPFLKGLNKWWSGYQQQKVVIIEEASPEACKFIAPLFKQWCDKWPFVAETKGGTFEHGIRPDYIFITSNYSLEECFPDQNDLLPMKRRVYEFYKETREAWLPFNFNEDLTQAMPPEPRQGVSNVQIDIEDSGTIEANNDSEAELLLKLAEPI